MGKDLLSDLLVGFATLTAFNWAATEFLPRAFPKLSLTKPLLAVLVGLISGPTAVYIHLVSVGDATGVKAYVAGAFISMVGVVLAGVAHEYGVKAILGTRGQ